MEKEKSFLLGRNSIGVMRGCFECAQKRYSCQIVKEVVDLAVSRDLGGQGSLQHGHQPHQTVSQKVKMWSCECCPVANTETFLMGKKLEVLMMRERWTVEAAA